MRVAGRPRHGGAARSRGRPHPVALIATLLGCALASTRAAALPRYEAVRAAHRPSDTLVLDRHGEPLQSLRTDARVRRLPWEALDGFSPALRQAVLASEDQRFVEHGGVDWGGLARSAVVNAGGSGARQGASTITMQLAGLIDAAQARPREGRSVGAKLGQMWAARRLEADWTKPQILEAYLNQVPLRGELVGVPAAARVLFGKHPSGLDAQESALVAALIRGPNAAPKVVAQRACGVLRRLRDEPAKAAASGHPPGPVPAGVGPGAAGPAGRAQDPADCRGLADWAAQVLLPGRAQPVAQTAWAPHFARALQKGQAAGSTRAATAPASGRADVDTAAPLRSSLDARLQRLATQALRQQLAELAGRHVEDGAVVVLDNASGEVLAWVGSSGSALSEAPAVDAVLARRQPGSTLKPFVYGLAFERRLITPASLLDDAPTALPAGGGLYLPQNYDRRHHGWVSARTALAASLNIPAVKLGAMLSPDALFERLNAFGLRLRHSGGWHGHALALGSAEVTLLDLSNAYRALANGGTWSPVRLTADAAAAAPGAAGTRRAADPAATWLVSDILADNTARALTFGLDSALVTRHWAAVKTGTSKDLRDNWCLGYTPRHTVGVWVGNASGAPMHRVSGTQGAAPVWRTVMAALQSGDFAPPPHRRAAPHAPQDAGAPEAPPRPAGLHTLAVDSADGLARIEHFLAGTVPAPAPVLRATAPAVMGIRTPGEGSIYTLDPDIPPTVQRLVFEGEAGVWQLDGRRLGQGARLAWAPWPGRHVLRLHLADGRVEERRFEVRGATVRMPARRHP